MNVMKIVKCFEFETVLKFIQKQSKLFPEVSH